MNGIVSVIENRINNEKVTEMYKNGEIARNEWLLLIATQSDGFLHKFMSGMAEFKLYNDINIDENSYYTNVSEVLRAYYTLYKKFPNYHFDKILSNYLLYMSKLINFPGGIYVVLTTLSYHLLNEKNNISPFKIENVLEILENSKKNVLRNKEFLKNTKLYEAENKKNGYLDIIKEYNNNFKTILNYDIFDENVGGKAL